MRYQKDKDLGWIITFGSFLVFLLAAIISSVTKAAPASLPEPVVLANAHLNVAFLSVATAFIRYVALIGIIYGIIGIITWPPGTG